MDLQNIGVMSYSIIYVMLSWFDWPYATKGKSVLNGEIWFGRVIKSFWALCSLVMQSELWTKRQLGMSNQIIVVLNSSCVIVSFFYSKLKNFFQIVAQVCVYIRKSKLLNWCSICIIKLFVTNSCVLLSDRLTESAKVSNHPLSFLLAIIRTK